MAALEEISALVKMAKQVANKIVKQEEALKSLKKDLEKILQVEIPDRMFDAELSYFVTDDGFGVKVEEKWTASLSENKKPYGIEWLKEHNQDSIVTNNFTFIFEKGTETQAEDFFQKWSKDAVLQSRMGRKEDVNTATYKKVLREYQEAKQLEGEGGELTKEELERLGVYVFNLAKIVDTRG